MNDTVYYISEASKKVEVEPHVLRYWEDELKLPIGRNEMGHRCYSEKDIETLRHIKRLKEQGLQLRAIRVVLQDGGQELYGTTRLADRYAGDETGQKAHLKAADVKDRELPNSGIEEEDKKTTEKFVRKRGDDRSKGGGYDYEESEEVYGYDVQGKGDCFGGTGGRGGTERVRGAR